jgi:serine/threonine protein phosphatase PrpC
VISKESGEQLFCVFDGHGPGGHEVSDFCADMLPSLFFDKMKKGNGSDESIKQCLHEAFVECQSRLKEAPDKKYRSDDSGSTCTVAYRGPGANCLFLAHVGDSRAVLCRGKEAVELTEDHKPDLPAEKKRIESKGGRVEWDGYFNHRVYTAEGKGGLNMSRALGDNYVKPAGVTEVPEIKKFELDKSDRFVMLCSDGVWEFIKSETAISIIEKFGKEKVDFAAEELAKRSYQEWMADSDNDISDDITVMVYWL